MREMVASRRGAKFPLPKSHVFKANIGACCHVCSTILSPTLSPNPTTRPLFCMHDDMATEDMKNFFLTQLENYSQDLCVCFLDSLTLFTLIPLSSFPLPLPLVHLGCFLIFHLHSNTKYSLFSHKFNLKVPNLLLINYIND